MIIRPYQSEGLEFLTSRPNGRAALWDRPGLGKSMQSLLAMNYLVQDRARILIVATGDAVGVWQDETLKWLDEEAAVYAGPKAKLSALDHHGVVVVNYHRVEHALMRGGWDGVIFDESQMLRNRNTRTLFKTVRAEFDDRKTGYWRVPAFFLSGTPIVKSTGDIWPILHLIDKTRWRSYWDFVQKYAIVWQDIHGWHVEGVTNLNALWAETKSVALRRLVGEVELPPKTRQRVRLTMTPKQAAFYHQMRKEMWAEVDDGSLMLSPSALVKETRLRQVLACPRIVGIDDDGAAIKDLTEIAERSHDPFVVFTPFAEAIPHIRRALERAGRPTYNVQGGMGAGLARSIDLFKRAVSAGEAPVIVSTVQMGKSWSVASYANEAYMVGVDWNETTMDQAESRLNRDGQLLPMFARYFVHEGSHDMDALDILLGKKRLADAILDGKTPRGRRKVTVANRNSR